VRAVAFGLAPIRGAITRACNTIAQVLEFAMKLIQTTKHLGGVINGA
jgi:hypothetical protein